MTKIFCDCCGKEINKDQRFIMAEHFGVEIGGQRRQMILQFHELSGASEPQDVCRRCMISKCIEQLHLKIDAENAANKVKITPPSKTDLQPFMNAVDKEIRKMADSVYVTHCTLENNLTREQFQEALIQAVNSGDFMRHVAFGPAAGNPFMMGQSQMVDYIPFRRVRELEANKEELNGYLDTAINLLSQVKECTIDRDFRSASIENLCKNIELFKKGLNDETTL